jgi:hypothetical protein
MHDLTLSKLEQPINQNPKKRSVGSTINNYNLNEQTIICFAKATITAEHNGNVSDEGSEDIPTKKPTARINGNQMRLQK